MAVDLRRMEASWRDLESLKDHFKDGFPEYPLLDDDCKRRMIGCLESRALIRLGKCSKNEQRLAAEVPMKITAIEVSYDKCELDEGLVEFEKVVATVDEGEEHCVYFKHIGTGVVVEKLSGRVLWKDETGDYSKEAVKLLETLLKRCHYGVVTITMNMGQEARRWALRDASPIEDLPSVRAVELGRDSSHHLFWLTKVPVRLGTVQFNSDVSAEVVKLPQFRNAYRLICHCACDVTDAQLFELNAANASFAKAPRLTARGLNAYLKRWKRGGGVAGFRFLSIQCVGQKGDDFRMEALSAGLNAQELTRSEFVIRNVVRPAEHLRVSSNRRNFTAMVKTV